MPDRQSETSVFGLSAACRRLNRTASGFDQNKRTRTIVSTDHTDEERERGTRVRRWRKPMRERIRPALAVRPTGFRPAESTNCKYRLECAPGGQRDGRFEGREEADDDERLITDIEASRTNEWVFRSHQKRRLVLDALICRYIESFLADLHPAIAEAGR